MQTDSILDQIDKEITRLEQARALLTGEARNEQTLKRRGRAKGSKSSAVKESAAVAKTPRRTMSEAGKARIAAAQKARWAAQKKSASRVK